MLNPKDLRQRAQAAWQVADQWHPRHKEVYRWTMPPRYQAMEGIVGSAPTGYAEIYDGTAVGAVDDFASFVSEALYPFDAPWLRFVPRRDIPDDRRQELIELGEDLTKRVEFLFATSNFHPAAFVANKDLSVGTKIVRAEIDPDSPRRIWFTPVPPYTAAIEDNAYGKYSGVYIKIKGKVVDIWHRYQGGKFSPDFHKLLVDNPTREVTVCESVVFEPKEQRWSFYVTEEANLGKEYDDYITTASYLTSPYIVTRWSKTPGMAWGVGPTYQTLADIKTANKLVELVLKNAAIAVSGIWQADDDGVLNPSNIRLVPGAIIPKSPNSDGLTPLQAPGRFDVSDLVLNDIRARINAAHFTQKLPEREMTAYEAQERMKQQQRQLRGVFGQLMSEDVAPTVARVMDLGRQMGMIPQQKIEDELDLELVGPLAQNIKEAEANKVFNFAGVLGATFGPQIAFAALNVDAIIPDLAENMGVSRQYVKSKAKLREMQQQVQQMAAQVMAQQLNQPGEVAPR